MTSSRPSPTPDTELSPRQVLAGAVEALTDYWSGRDVVLLVSQYIGIVAKLIGELESCGARVQAVITANLPAADAPPVPHVWSAAQQGFPGLSQRQFDALLAEPPDSLTEWLRARDPQRSWTFVGSTHTQTGLVGDYVVHGWRRPLWGSWEDKVVVEELWREANVQSAPHAICTPDDPDLADRAVELDRGFGVVMAVDASREITGAAIGLRWIRTREELDSAREWSSGAADRIRITPFIPGTPFSILGMALESGVAVFDPVEIVTVVNDRLSRFLYCGTSSFWRPNEDVTAVIREKARMTGEYLSGLGYRGIFGVDGIATGDGEIFLTELNPRHPAGLGVRAAWPDFPIYILQRGIQEAMPGLYDLDHREMERAIRDLVRETPSAAVRVPLGADPVRPGNSADPTGTALTLTLDPESTTLPQEQVVTFSVDGDAATLISVHPMLADGSIAPAAAALSKSVGTEELIAPRDVPDSATLTASSLTE